MFERFTERARQVVVLAQEEARVELGHDYIGPEHILLGLAHEIEGVVTRSLLDFDAKPEKIRDEIMRRLAGSSSREPGLRTGMKRRAPRSGRAAIGPRDTFSSWRARRRT